MPLHPQVKAITDAAPARNFREGTVEQARASHAAASAARPKGPEMDSVDDMRVAGVAVRGYRPAGASGAALVFLHGGGFVLGSVETHDGPCRYLADASGATVLSVEYRLAPEHRFPAAFDDTVAVTSAVLDGAVDGIDTARIAIGGDSAGGNLAAAASIELRGSPGPALRGQLLIYPATDRSMSTDSYVECAAGPFLTAEAMEWFYNHYAPGVDQSDWRLSPSACSDLSGLPPALVITAETDVLRDEGESYAQALAAAGVDASAARHLGATHGFFGWTHAAAPSRAALHQAAAWLRATTSQLVTPT